MPWDFWLIFILLGAILPWRGYARLQKLFALPQMTSRDRLALYASTIAFQWLAAALVYWRAHARGLSRADLGLMHIWTPKPVLAGFVGGAAIAGLQWLNLRRLGTSPSRARGFMQRLATRILPQSSREFLAYLALAITAGICEEFLYRGFAMAALARAGLAAWAVVLVSSLFFGLAHLYQGVGGSVSTLLLGTIFGTARIVYNGLLPVMMWHTGIDAVAGVAGPKYLLNLPPESSADQKVTVEN